MPPQIKPTLTQNAGTSLDPNIIDFADGDKATLRAATRAYLVALYGAGTNMSATQRFAITEAIAKIDEETNAGVRPEISLSNSVANGVMYGLRTAFEAVPVITSSLTASGTHSVAITPYQITASHGVQTFGATGLPTGLTLNATTGVISGTLGSGTAGTVTSTISATNEGGTGSASLVWTIA